MSCKIKLFFGILTLIVLISSTNSFAQETLIKKPLFEETEQKIFSNPDDAFRFAKFLAEKSVTPEDKQTASILLARIYKVKGDYNMALRQLFEIRKEIGQKESSNAVVVDIEIAEVLGKLMMGIQSEGFINRAEEKNQKNSDENKRNVFSIYTKKQRAELFLLRKKYDEAEKEFKSINIDFIQAENVKENLAVSLDIFNSKLKLETYNFFAAKRLLEKSYQELLSFKTRNFLSEIYVLIGLSDVATHEKNYTKAVEYLLTALERNKFLNNLYLSETINQKLATNYILLNNSEKYKYYNEIFLSNHSKLEVLEKEALNSAYNLIANEQVEFYKNQKAEYLNNFYVICSIIMTVLLVLFILAFKYYQKKKRLLEIIKYLKVTQNNLVVEFNEKKDPVKKISIPQETEQLILNKLKRFENSTRFTNKDISLAVLAGQFETNTKYLSEIINNHYNVNFNTYINKLRINYVVEKLKNDPNFINYKISYLADECGFSSHSSFATVFKNITGITPITFIELLKNEREAELIENSENYAE